ncbi:alpha/beta fold hydrolase [Lyngbya confervoides]|uniref:Alpha/beta hydrolase n=1 Tax=Lyngbya confervoides BDU141951 TaxID=1574623 RepID=A0ABD4T827_9CYAN|nr:alpha/beta hydrolase [Lyngbya confervoides]MCM1984628.1 alpha/beta hydrolase [Lyngbya confervoides BDU141951]
MPPKTSPDSPAGSTFVFLHYFGGSAQSWRWVTDRMPTSRCIALDLPGFGGRPALETPSLSAYGQSVLRDLERFAVTDYILVGHSMGGKLALQVAIQSDRPPQQLVLVAPSPPTQEPMPESEKTRLLENHPSLENAATTVKNATHRPLSPDQQSLALETHQVVEASAWRWWLREGMNHSLAESAAQLSLPITVLASQDDPVIPATRLRQDIEQYLPQAKAYFIAGVGHLIPLEAPDWVAHHLQIVAEAAWADSS